MSVCVRVCPCACVAQGMSEVSVLKWTLTVWCVFYRVLFYSVQWLYCVCTPQSTRTGGGACFTVYIGCILHVLQLVDVSVSVHWLYFACAPQSTRTGGSVCFTVYHGSIVCVLHSLQGLVDVSVSQCTMPVLCMCSTEYKDWWLPKVEEVMVDKQRAQKQTAPSSAPDASDEKVCYLSHA